MKEVKEGGRKSGNGWFLESWNERGKGLRKKSTDTLGNKKRKKPQYAYQLVSETNIHRVAMRDRTSLGIMGTKAALDIQHFKTEQHSCSVNSIGSEITDTSILRKLTAALE